MLPTKLAKDMKPIRDVQVFYLHAPSFLTYMLLLKLEMTNKIIEYQF